MEDLKRDDAFGELIFLNLTPLLPYKKYHGRYFLSILLIKSGMGEYAKLNRPRHCVSLRRSLWNFNLASLWDNSNVVSLFEFESSPATISKKNDMKPFFFSVAVCIIQSSKLFRAKSKRLKRTRQGETICLGERIRPASADFPPARGV